MKKIKELTRAELEVMQIIWKKERAFMGEIVSEFENSEKKPAYTTIATIVRILERKGFVTHTTYGKSNQYYPLVSKELYRGDFLINTLSNLFDDSPRALISYFTEEGKLSVEQYEELKSIAKKIAEEK